MNQLRDRMLSAERSRAGDALSNEDRALIAAWRARVEHEHRGAPVPTRTQLRLLAKPDFAQQLQQALGRSAASRRSRFH